MGVFQGRRILPVFAEDILPVGRTDLREFELVVVLVHAVDLLTGRRAKNLDDFDQLVNA